MQRIRSEIRLLQTLPDVKDLSIGFNFDDYAYHHLSLDDDGGRLCPHLEKLDIYHEQIANSLIVGSICLRLAIAAETNSELLSKVAHRTRLRDG